MKILLMRLLEIYSIVVNINNYNIAYAKTINFEDYILSNAIILDFGFWIFLSELVKTRSLTVFVITVRNNRELLCNKFTNCVD